MTKIARKRRRLLWWVVVLGVVGLVAAAALVVTAQPVFCQTCHLMKTRYVSWERSTHHPEADCLDCHAEPGLWGELKAHINGARYVYVLFTGRPEVILRARVPSGTCIQCHDLNEIDQERGAIAAAHRDHQSAGVGCEVCHKGFHDEIEGGSLAVSASVCEECHPASGQSNPRDTMDRPFNQQRSWSTDGVP